MFKIIKNVALLFVFSLILVSANTSAQDSADACNINRLNLASVGLLLKSAGFATEEITHTPVMRVIIVASLGAKETDRKYNVQRLEEIKKYFTREQGIPDGFLILAQGEKRKDKGAVEIYYGGVLQYDITFKPKQRLILEEGKDPCTY